MNIRYTRGDRGEIVKEHRFVNHSKEYAKDGVHVNIHHSVPDGLGGNERTGYLVLPSFNLNLTLPILQKHL